MAADGSAAQAEPAGREMPDAREADADKPAPTAAKGRKRMRTGVTSHMAGAVGGLNAQGLSSLNLLNRTKSGLKYGDYSFRAPQNMTKAAGPRS